MTRRLTGQRFGPYEIGSLLGSGGMGDVYRARDTRLGRDVAIKFLPELFALDPARRARFEREARLLAALNHPHIGAIYGFEDNDELHGLILELVDGQTLAARLSARPLPIREALAIARQIALALEAAHEKGIVHRDLKPANVALTQDGVVKVLDFGLAKAAADHSTPDATSAPTVICSETHAGVLLGTTAYMSPEQARGQEVDKRTDLWAFGCVLWEMLTARKAFARDTTSDTIAAVLDHDVDWRHLPAATPPNVTRLLRRCLEKDPKRRLHDIADARIEIEDELQSPMRATSPARRRAMWQRVARAAAIVTILATIVAAGAIYWPRAPAVATPTRLSIWTPGIVAPQLSAAISPDGLHVAFVSTAGSGKLMLWLRPLDSLEARVLPGTENAAHPFWSPDSQFLGFQADGKIKTVAGRGGAVETLADGHVRAGGSWSRDGMILFPRQGQLAVVPAEGGPIVTVIEPGRQPLWPHFLPDGRRFLYFYGGSGPEERGVYVGSLDSKRTRLLLQTDVKAAYAPGYLLFVRGVTLMAQPFDVERLQLTGSPSRVADSIWMSRPAGQVSFSVSQTGVLAYVNANRGLGLAWFDRTGQPRGTMREPGHYGFPPQLSPDGRRVAVSQGPSPSHIWLLDVAGESTSRMTFGSSNEDNPVWSPDGSRIAYSAGGRLYLKNTSGAGVEELVADVPSIVALQDWSRDNRFLVFTGRGKQGASDLWVVPLSGERRPVPFLETAFNKAQAQVSPDGRWIAYTSYESGGDEVYVQSFPAPGNKRQVSIAGGVQPRWRDDGKELFYVAADQRMMSVAVRSNATLELGAPAPLFKTAVIPHGSQSTGLSTQYDVSPDGQRFLCAVRPDEAGPPISVVLNWMAALK